MDLLASGAAGAARRDVPSPSVEAEPGPDAGLRSPGRGERLARRLVTGRLSRIAEGRLLLREGALLERFGSESPDGLHATLEILDPAAWARIARGGSLGAAEAYLDGLWTSADLVALVRLMARNREALAGLDADASWLARAGARIGHLLRDNTRRGSRRNIEAHYDLGNDFFRLFLDPSMTYSAALFERAGMTLEEAQTAKIDRLCRRLRLGPEDHLLEIGTGWGALSIHAAGTYGCRVTTTTISPAQRREAIARIEAAGLAHRVEVLDRDYRDLDGVYDKVVSVEMIEAVGHRRLDDFFATIDQRLAPDGLAAIQAITIADRNWKAATRSVDFIQRHVFPGGSIPSLTSIFEAMTRATRLTPLGVEELGLHYAETLRRWSRRFESRLDEVRALGFDDRFVRLWRYYFAYCEGGFRERAIGDAQIVLAGPAFRGPTELGSLA